MIPVAEGIMTRMARSVSPETSVEACAIEMARDGIGSLLVERDGDYIGIITEVDILRKVVAKRREPSTVSAEEIMAAPLITVEADQSLVDVNALMEKERIRHLGVCRYGKVVGMISVRDLLHPLIIEEDVPLIH
ncbi:MAG: cyclic nucleotide-binding/CBS domain-containing protein [Nitrospiria bacterium]